MVLFPAPVRPVRGNLLAFLHSKAQAVQHFLIALITKMHVLQLHAGGTRHGLRGGFSGGNALCLRQKSR